MSNIKAAVCDGGVHRFASVTMLDREVMKLHGLSVRDIDEAACVAALMERYQKLQNKKANHLA